jgi:hypothetical protein
MPVKLVKLIKMFLNEIYSEVIWINICLCLAEWTETRVCFSTIALQFCFKIWAHRGIGNEWGKSTSVESHGGMVE